MEKIYIAKTKNDENELVCFTENYLKFVRKHKKTPEGIAVNVPSIEIVSSTGMSPSPSDDEQHGDDWPSEREYSIRKQADEDAEQIIQDAMRRALTAVPPSYVVLRQYDEVPSSRVRIVGEVGEQAEQDAYNSLLNISRQIEDDEASNILLNMSNQTEYEAANALLNIQIEQASLAAQASQKVVDPLHEKTKYDQQQARQKRRILEESDSVEGDDELERTTKKDHSTGFLGVYPDRDMFEARTPKGWVDIGKVTHIGQYATAIAAARGRHKWMKQNPRRKDAHQQVKKVFLKRKCGYCKTLLGKCGHWDNISSEAPTCKQCGASVCVNHNFSRMSERHAGPGKCPESRTPKKREERQEAIPAPQHEQSGEVAGHEEFIIQPLARPLCRKSVLPRRYSDS